MEIIDSFRDEFAFLSNFYPASVTLDNFHYRTVEHAYQAAKTFDAAQRAMIALYSSPATAKQFGKKVTLRNDWELIKEQAMLDLLRQKFAIPELRAKLIATAKARLIEGNYWNDTYWGVCNGQGKNRLGILLMKVRDEIF